eukprot:GHVU01173476.1.p2 GENE.GHVU01173476.1~~GHVU01173476.1.p2  ORF type:complete len:205 (+),score=41.20 GHVU01173476.1:1614-2228(+)
MPAPMVSEQIVDLSCIPDVNAELFDDGDFDLGQGMLANAVIVEDHEALTGYWELIKERSESSDGLMAALGVGKLKRMALNNSTPGLTLGKVMKQENTGKPFVNLVSHLPLGITKSADIFLDGEEFHIEDGDTGGWKTKATFRKGRVLQRRESEKGVMYDVRAVFEKDPEGKVPDSPVLIFKWTFIEAKTNKKFVAHRWFKKVPT